jgi:murein L,D-transpeptidase YcbB/YkuD
VRLARICAILAGICWAQVVYPEQVAPEPALRSQIESGTLSSLRWPNFSSSQRYVASFYQSTGYSLVWTSQGAATPQAIDVVQVLRHADAKGLDPDDYDGSRWPARLARLRPNCPQPADPDLVAFDLALTVSTLRYVSDVSIGKVNPKVFCFGLDVDQKKCDLTGVLLRLRSATDAAALIEQLEPPFDGYRRAEKALAAYITLAREDDGELLPAIKKPVEPGDAYPGVARLERLLRFVGDLSPAARKLDSFKIYQGALVEAMKHFQTRHGLDSDGRIGKATFKQLNTPLSGRLRQLQFALERWRWIPSSFSRPPIIVNIPEFRLRALNDHYETELEMKVVVGGAYRHKTPVFTNYMTHVIFRPYWNVPLSIQRAELAPKIAKDRSYLADNDYEIVNARGKVVASGAAVTSEQLVLLRSGELAIRQIPGNKNALGFIKFIFPNEYNVYLHGTPAQALFSKSRRDFSHGCIRVERPEELAAWVFKDQPEWTMDRIRQSEKGTQTRQVNLEKPIQVLIIYATAMVNQNGEVFFFDDIYGHDAALDRVLAKGYPYSGWQPTTGRGQRRATP